MQGVINYTGNKSDIIDDIICKLTSFTRFVDLFCGGLSVSMTIADKFKCPVVSNDFQKPLIDMFKDLKLERYDRDMIIDVINYHKLNKTDKEQYYKVSELYNTTGDPILLYILLQHSYSNIARFNQKGKFNSPFGKRTINDNTFTRLENFNNLCDMLTFSNKSYDCVDILDGDFVYCDPPYIITNAEYNHMWKMSDEYNLLTYLDELNKRGIKFGLSNVIEHRGKSHEVLKKWMKKYNFEILDKSYCIGNTVANSDKTIEVYIHN